MTLVSKHLIASIALGAGLLAALGARADVVYLPDQNALFQGAGLGAVNTVLTLGSPGSSSTEIGAVFAEGTGFATSGDTFTGASQVGLPTLGALGITSSADLRIILNAVEPSGNQILVSNLELTFYNAQGSAWSTYSLAAPVNIASTLTGIGNAGFVFGLDGVQAAAANTFIGLTGTDFANIRVGLSARLDNATGGLETFFIAAAPMVSAVPEPATSAMMLAGLAALGFMARRRLGT